MYVNSRIAVGLIWLVISLINGCQHDNPTPDDNTSGLFHRSLEHDGIQRTYAVYIPAFEPGDSLPVVFELHGGGIYMEDMTGESGYKSPYKLWMDLAGTEKFIVVYPEGLNGAYGKPTWNDCRGDCIVNSDADDTGFIQSLISKLKESYPVDDSRIYIFGTSNGGFMVERLAAEMTGQIAAAAVVVAALPAVNECPVPSLPLSILYMNGTSDNHMPYEGGYVSNPPNPDHGSVISTVETIEFWKSFNQTSATPEYEVFPDLDPNDGSTVEKFVYSGGIDGTEVVFYKIDGGGHSAPSIKERYSALFEQYFNKQNHDIEMTTEVWNFFKTKSRN